MKEGTFAFLRGGVIVLAAGILGIGCNNIHDIDLSEKLVMLFPISS
jgi:hypothetical protein